MAKKNIEKELTQQNLNKSLMHYLDNSPTPYHAVANAEEMLVEKGFKELCEGDKWKVAAKGKYYIKRNNSSLIAFSLSAPMAQGFRMYGAHTDSPCLKVKPNSDRRFKNYLQIAVEPYGGSLLSTWFDRGLSLAGRVNYLTKKGERAQLLIDFRRPVAFIPNLAIHLDRQANDGKSYNKQRDLPPVLMQFDNNNKEMGLKDLVQTEIEKRDLAPNLERILDFDLSFYDAQEAEYVGWYDEFILSSRIDNLLSCHVGLMSFLDTDGINKLLVFNDHEECGSTSQVGADGPFLESVLKRLAKDEEDYARMIFNSFFISADNAHGVHPNFSDRHEDNHAPLLNVGPVIKINTNQRYSTTDETAAIFMRLCQMSEVPYQKFVARSDLGCGSTIGPITTSRIGVRAVDIGLPTWAMHSIRESMGSKDAFYLYKALSVYFTEKEI